MFSHIIDFIRSIYPDKDNIPLHEPSFRGKEKEYVSAAIDSTFVSSVGEFVERFEETIKNIVMKENDDLVEFVKIAVLPYGEGKSCDAAGNESDKNG